MARPRKDRPQEPPELGGSPEERNRHLRYAHEQYSGSGQGRFGAPVDQGKGGRNLPLQKPAAKQQDYPPGTKMPWPPDSAIEAEQKRTRRRPK
jgi:hypothetical protein